MHILMPIHSFEPGGVERVGLNLAAAWQDSGEEVTVLLGRYDGAMAQDAPRLNYVSQASAIPTAPVETLWLVWCLWRYLRGNRVDVLFCPGNSYAIVCVAVKLLLGRKCPAIVIKISNDLERRDMPRIGRQAYRLWLRMQSRLIDRFVALSLAMATEIEQLARVPVSRISIVDNASLSEARFSALAAIDRDTRPCASLNYLSVGRMVTQKNYALLLAAFARGATRGSSLVILGEGPERPNLERLAHRLGIAGRVSMPGYYTDIDPWLCGADILLLSSDYEGLPSVVVEAMAAGLPVIATDCCVSMAGLLGHGRFGQIVPVGDETRLAHAIARAGTSPHSPQAARSAAHAFTIAHVARRYIPIFRSVIEPCEPLGAPVGNPDKSVT